MADWTSLLPRAEKPESAADVYEHAAKMQQMRQTAVYNQARIAEENALAAQHQRVTDAKNGLAQAIAKHTQYGDDGTAKVNYAGAIKDINEAGFGDVTPDLLKEASTQLNSDLDTHKKKAERLGDLSGNSFRVQNWQDPAEVSRARDESLRSIDQAVSEGLVDPQTAATYRAQAANYTPDFQSHLDQLSATGKSLGTRFTQAKESTQALVDHLTAPSKVTEAQAKADEAVAAASGQELGLAGRIAGAGGYPAQSSSGFDPGQAENPYQATPMPQGAAAAQTAPQQPATPPPPAAGAPRTTVPASQATPVQQPPGNVSGSRFNTNRAPVTPASQYDTTAAEPKPAGWTQEKQDQLEAFRSDPAFARVARFLPKQAGNSADAVIKAYGLTREQQVQQQERENKPENEDKELKSWATKLGAAAERGPGSYAKMLATAPEKIASQFPDPDRWDPTKTPLQIRAFGMTPNEQNTAAKPPKSANGMSESQARMWIDRHDKLQTEEQETWKHVGEVGDILNTPNGESFRDPKTGKSVDMDAQQRTYWQKEYEGARGRATELQKQAKEIRGRLKVGEFEPGAEGGTPATPAPKPSAAPPSPTAPSSPANGAPPPPQRIRVTIPPRKLKDGTMAPAKEFVFPNQQALDKFSEESGYSFSAK